MLKALSVAWSSVRAFYGELFPLVGQSLLWFVFSLPFAGIVMLLFAIAGGLVPGLSYLSTPADLGVYFFWAVLVVVLVVPSPAAAGVHYYANQLARHQLLEFGYVWIGLRRYGLKSAAFFAIGVLGLLLLLFNLSFYVNATNDVVRLASVLFLYILYFWMTMQMYILPLIIEYPQRSMLTILRNAAVMGLDNLGFTAVLFVLLAVVCLLSLLITPLVPLVLGGLAAVVQNKALLNRLEKYGLYKEEQ